jgi:hypothetical protein
MAHKDNIKNAENAAKSLQVVEEVEAPPEVPFVKAVNQSGNSTGAVQLRPVQGA